ncbi:MAG: hypothetical protein JXB30_11530 [Anaerolineae bacterium]|nr:hypothetical protein [Anaerolineae bacterium]
MHKKHTKRMLIVLSILLAATLACDLAGPTSADTPQPSFSTATPGGSISVSLLTPTLPLPGLPAQFTTPIGPVATATSAAATAAALTSTAAAPSPTVPGIFVEPAQCPPAGSPALPDTPPIFSRYAEKIVTYLSAGGAPTILEATLRNWKAITDDGGLVRSDRDFTGDGVPEVFVVLLDPQSEDYNPQPGDLYIFGCQEGAYRLLYQVGYKPEQGAPIVTSADDINGNYVNDLVYTIKTCTDLGCEGKTSILEWNITLGNFSSLLTNEITTVEPEVVVSDVDEDGLSEVSVTTGTIRNPSAGPQRKVTNIYKWDGSLYVLSQLLKSPAQYRIHVIYDGDDALAAHDYKAAIEAYKQASTNEELKGWLYADEFQYLSAFARYRLMLAYVLGNNIDKAQATHDELIGQYAPPPPLPPPEGEATATPTPQAGPLPGAEFATLADVFWQNFTVNRDVSRACSQVIDSVDKNSSILSLLNSFGYANRQYRPVDICPSGG